MTLPRPSPSTRARGGVYVTGYSYAGSGTQAYATVAYDPSGNEIWVARDPTGTYGRWPARVAVDSASGHVYLAGLGNVQDKRRSDYLTVAYDASGNRLWAAQYHGPISDALDGPNDIALDSSLGRVYVTGSGAATVAYDAIGNQLWVARSAQAGGGSIAVDGNSHNIFGTGAWSDGGDNSSRATVAYDPGGNQLWVALYHEAGSRYDGGFGIAVAQTSGQVYVAGESVFYDPPSSTVTTTTVACDPSGNQLWVTPIVTLRTY